MKTTDHGYASDDVYIGGRRPRPEAGSRRSRMGSAAFMAQKYHAEPPRAPRVRLFNHLSPLGTLRRAVSLPASMAAVRSPRTQRLGVYSPPFGAHGCSSALRPSVLPAGRLISLGKRTTLDTPEAEIQDRKLISQLRQDGQDDRMITDLDSQKPPVHPAIQSKTDL